MKPRFVTQMLIVLVAILAWSTPLAQETARARESACEWLDAVQELGYEETEVLPGLGCRLNDDDKWIAGRILEVDQHLSIVRRSDRETVGDGKELLIDSIQEMLNDRRIQRVMEYDLESGDFRQLRLGSNEWISLAGEPLVGADFGVNADSLYQEYADVAIAYLEKPGHEILADYAVWYLRWRDSAIDDILDGGYTPLYQETIMTSLEYNQLAWPWQLADESAMTEYLLWFIETNDL